MAKRQHKQYRTLDSSAVQGEGSFVKVKNLTIQEIMQHSQNGAVNGKGQKVDEKKAAALGLQVLDAMIVDWDWVDDDDNPLPIPAQTPGTVACLPFQEATWLLKETGIEKLLDQKN